MNKKIFHKILDIYNIRFDKDNLTKNILNVNDKQLVFNILQNPIMVFKVRYTYTTIRGNKKDGMKYFIENTTNPQFDIEDSFNKWIESYNKENKNRPLLNVKFLDSESVLLLTQ